MPKKRKTGETTPVYGTMCAELPVITGEMVGGPKLETKQFQTASLDFFKKQCIRSGHSVEQVLREIVNEGLRMWVLDQDGRLKEIPAMDFLTPDNLLDFLQDQNVVFPLAHARFFWKHTAPDFKGGWQVEASMAPVVEVADQPSGRTGKQTNKDAWRKSVQGIVSVFFYKFGLKPKSQLPSFNSFKNKINKHCNEAIPSMVEAAWTGIPDRCKHGSAPRIAHDEQWTSGLPKKTATAIVSALFQVFVRDQKAGHGKLTKKSFERLVFDHCKEEKISPLITAIDAAWCSIPKEYKFKGLPPAHPPH